MKRLKIFLIIFLFVFTFFAPKMVFAEGTCPCSCKDAGGAITSVGTLSETDCKAKCTVAVASCVVSATTTPTPTPAPTTPAPVTAVKAKICTAGCYCTSVGGAVLQKGDFTQQACISKCAEAAGQRVAACAFSVEQTPDRSPYCFTKELCKKQNGVLDTDPLIGKKQALDCPAGLGYCFPNPSKTVKSELNVAIGDYKISADVNEYMNKLIDWMLGVGIVFVIIFVMIGGLQYMLGAASPAMVSKGKALITRSITGLILLLCSWLALNTINPYLLKGQIPKFPMVKRVELVGSASCEDMEKDGYGTKTLKGDADIKAADKKCGTSATIAPKKDGTPVTGATTCDFKKCPSEDQRCLGKGSTATCLACKDVAPGVSNISVSEESCKALKLPTTFKKVDGKDVPVINYCSLTHDTDALFVSPAWTTAKNAFLLTNPIGLSITAITALMPSQTTAQKEDIQRVVKGACGVVTIDCSTITKCEDYDEPKFETKFTGTKLDNMQEGTVVTGTVSIHSICKENPCAVTKGGKVTTNCLVDDSDLVATDCHTSEGTLAGAADGCAGMKCSEGANQCINDAAGNPVCASCGNITDDNTLAKDGALIVATPSMCDKFDTPTMNCEYTKESALTSMSLNSYGSCAEVYLDCTEIDDCTDYDTVDADNDTKWGKVELEDTNTFKTKPLLKKFCEENPCVKQIGHACEYDGGSDCENP